MSHDDKKGWVAFFIAAIIIALCALSLCGCDTATADEAPVKHASGMPLDAISYDPPVWLEDCFAAWKVHDRNTGDDWWLLEVGTGHGHEYVVLPLSESSGW